MLDEARRAVACAEQIAAKLSRTKDNGDVLYYAAIYHHWYTEAVRILSNLSPAYKSGALFYQLKLSRRKAQQYI